jgi:CheY-like chemotaxis protein
MDLIMPVMDGLTATTIIKKELKINIPVIALTMDTSPDVISQCEAIGFSGFCSKPMPTAQLLMYREYTIVAWQNREWRAIATFFTQRHYSIY